MTGYYTPNCSPKSRKKVTPNSGLLASQAFFDDAELPTSSPVPGRASLCIAAPTLGATLVRILGYFGS